MARLLSSWKEIAAYFGKSVRTVQRWEGKSSLPVRRPNSRNQRIVFAVPEEIDEWAAQRRGTRSAQSNYFLAARRQAQMLEGWEQIAGHLGKSVRTVQRWERELQLPVHRPSGKRIITYAVAEEISQWICLGTQNVHGDASMLRAGARSLVSPQTVQAGCNSGAPYMHSGEIAMRDCESHISGKQGAALYEPYACDVACNLSATFRTVATSH